MVEPEYYSQYGLSPLKAFEQGLISKEQFIGFCKGNVIKYTCRAGSKDDPLLDIVKAMDYLTYLHKALKEDDETSDILKGGRLEYPPETVVPAEDKTRKFPVNGEKKDASELQGNILTRLHKTMWKRKDTEEY
ncbi:MAG: DUF3310 domain-containing protein [Methanobrevibacter sp.]|nr:DUF3310 domain-containing protein [Methanobrevibacter sp.]